VVEKQILFEDDNKKSNDKSKSFDAKGAKLKYKFRKV